MEALILRREEYKTEFKFMDAMIANTDGETRRESPNIKIFGMISSSTSKQYGKSKMKQVKTRKAYTNI